VAERLIQTSPASYPFNWGEGVQMIGLMKIYERARAERYADYVEKWAAIYLPRDMTELLNICPKARGTQPGYCGHWSPATAILEMYQARQKPEHLKLAVKVAEFIRTDAERSPEGGLGHWLGSHQLWVDTLYMACPLLAALGKLQGKDEYIDDAAGQLIVFARHLQDPETGLFYHMWDWQTGTHTPDPWGRGNGWVLMSLADTFEVMGRRHRSYAPLKTVAEKLAEGLKATQNQDGLWHTVLDDSSSYAEASASSMFCYGLLKLVRLNVLPASYVPLARRAWSAVNEHYVKDGVVTGVSAGTSPKGGDYYRSLPQGAQTWGTGAYLMAGSEVDRLR
jgi:unsaturated rhamnogalacturonyl hydrolase